MSADAKRVRPQGPGRWGRVGSISQGVLLVTAIILASTTTYLNFVGQPSPPQSVSTLMVRLNYFPEGGTLPLLVHFYANVTGGKAPYSYYWNFGDGTNSTTGPDVQHTYESQAYEGVMLRVTCFGGRLETTTTTHVVVIY